MFKTIFKISKMDCASEEQLIRMKLDGRNEIKNLDFDIPKRTLTIIHTGDSKEIDKELKELNLGSELVSITETNDQINIAQNDKKEKKMLWAVLIINFVFFVVEMLFGWISKSMGLVADSLDMLADALVYALSLWAVGASTMRKKRVAKLSGYFQISLAVFGLVEVLRRFLGMESIPVFQTMIIVSFLALIANSVSLYLIQKAKSKEAHMQASSIFTSNDIVINIGVIVAAVLVYFTQSKYPDLIIGIIIFGIVIRGALRILKLAK